MSRAYYHFLDERRGIIVFIKLFRDISGLQKIVEVRFIVFMVPAFRPGNRSTEAIS
jgi:hypothetical protein